MKNMVITIGREFGSGGKYIGSEAAKRLNIPFYDKEILAETYEKNEVNYSKLEEYDETKKLQILSVLNILQTDAYNEISLGDFYQNLIHETVKDLALNSCVILGRNSNNILKDKSNALHIFIYSKDLEFKIERKMKLENLTYKEAFDKLKRVDRQRKKYYEYVNPDQKWGDKSHYDICLDSGKLGIEKTIDLIVSMYQNLSK